MRRFFGIGALLTFLVSFSAVHAAENQYQAGHIISVEKKAHERVLYYLVNTPVTRDDPYYEISLQVGGTLFFTEYAPRHAGDQIPDGWKTGAAVEVKIADRRHAWVRQAGGDELPLLIVKRTARGVSPLPEPMSIQK